MKTTEKRNWFVYVEEIIGTKRTLIASGLTQLEAQELYEECSRNCERNSPNEYASYDYTESDAGSFIAKKLGII